MNGNPLGENEDAGVLRRHSPCVGPSPPGVMEQYEILRIVSDENLFCLSCGQKVLIVTSFSRTETTHRDGNVAVRS